MEGEVPIGSRKLVEEQEIRSNTRSQDIDRG